MTECTQSEFGFAAHFSRQVVARFDGGAMTTDAGGLLLRETERRLHLLGRLAECFVDRRNANLIRHSVRELVAQRVYALALGYEDLNDHDQLRQDPVLRLLAGKQEIGEEPLAGKSTLQRLEANDGAASRYSKITYWRDAIDELLVNIFLEAHAAPPDEIDLDIDTTDVELHGGQEGRFFHGYYDEYCYLPLYIFCGEHLLGVRLRSANIDASAGSLREIARIIGQIRQRWPEVRITLRGDSGFCRDELMSWCEHNGVDYVFGFARNERLRRLLAEAMGQAARQYQETQKPARVFVEFPYQTTTGSWEGARRVVAKAEYIDGKENPRYVVTSLAAEVWPAQRLYEERYCARGEMENRIKEQFTLFADRASAETMRANQLRMYLSAMAYVLVCGLRRLGLQATELASAQGATIRARLLQIGGIVRVSVRRVVLSLAAGYPWGKVFAQAHAHLTGAAAG
jgi:Transposase DDE domain group 1